MASTWRDSESHVRGTVVNVGLMSSTVAPSATKSSKSGSSYGSNKHTTSRGSVTASELAGFEEDLKKPSGPPPSSRKATVTREELERIKATVATRREEISKLIIQVNKAEIVYICFVVDCTSSMQPYIEATKNCVIRLAKNMQSAYANLTLQLGFVRYTDFDQGSSRTSIFQFSKSIANFERYVGTITAGGGGDGPEDVFGGLDTALNMLNWGSTENTNVLIHIADAPCHGSIYHPYADDHPNGDPNGITLEELMRRVSALRLRYWFGRTGSATDLMIAQFNKQLAKENPQHPPIDTFAALDDSVSLAKAVTVAAVTSVTGTITAASLAGNGSEFRDYRLVKGIPTDWSSFPLLQAVQQTFRLPDMEQIISINGAFERKQITVHLRVAPQPFAEGAVRLAYHARVYFNSDFDESKAKHVVVKLMKRKGANSSYKHYIQELETAAVAAKLALDYNAALKERSITATMITFGVAKIAVFETDPTDHTKSHASSSTSGHFLSSSTSFLADRTVFNMETYIPGTYEKFTTNSGFIEDSDLAREFSAFSHWTYAKTGGKVMIVDLQGVKNDKGLILVDPAVHSNNLHRFGRTNLGPDGFLRFFKTHECSELCKKLDIVDIRL